MSRKETGAANRATLRTKIRAWAETPANITHGWLLLCTVVAFVFIFCALYAVVQTVEFDNRLTREQVAFALEQDRVACEAENARRAEARVIALDDVEADRDGVASDRAVWLIIDDMLAEGLPEPSRTQIFTEFDRRDGLIGPRVSRIEQTYAPDECTDPVAAATPVEVMNSVAIVEGE